MVKLKYELMPKARHLYVHEALPMKIISARLNVSERTVQHWKADSRKDGDDWDKARGSVRMTQESVGTYAQQNIGEYMAFYHRIMGDIRDNETLTPMEKVAAMASLGDNYLKNLKAYELASRMDAFTRLQVANKVLNKLATFVVNNNPSLAPGLLSLLEPFGRELAKDFDT
jgi:hypothetical protein